MFSVANPATEDGNPDHQSTLKRLMHTVHTYHEWLSNDVDTVVLIHLQGDLFICLLAVSLHIGSMASEIIWQLTDSTISHPAVTTGFLGGEGTNSIIH